MKTMLSIIPFVKYILAKPLISFITWGILGQSPNPTSPLTPPEPLYVVAKVVLVEGLIYATTHVKKQRQNSVKNGVLKNTVGVSLNFFLFLRDNFRVFLSRNHII